MKDSHHKNGYLRIQMKLHNKIITEQIHSSLLKFGIKSKLYNYEDFSMIQINGKKNGLLFFDKINFEHPNKVKKIRAFL